MSALKRLDLPAQLRVLGKVEKLVEEMLASKTGVPVRTIKQRLVSFPEVFQAGDLVSWLMHRLEIRDKVEAVCVACAISSFGYFFPVDWTRSVSDDSSLHRFQNPGYWPSRRASPDNTEYAIFLAARTLRSKAKHELADYEMEAFQKLRMLLSWDEVLQPARTKHKLLRGLKKKDRNICDSQEKAFWRLHRPPPGQVRVMEFSKTKLAVQHQDEHRRRLFSVGKEEDEVIFYRRVLEKALCKVSRQCDSVIQHCKTFCDYDPMLASSSSTNPWITEDTTLWDQEMQHIYPKRASLWSLSFGKLLADSTGQQTFYKFCQKEFSCENLRFWQDCQRFKQLPASHLLKEAKKIYTQYIDPDAPNPVNVNHRVVDGVRGNLDKPSRYIFEDAEDHIYKLMETDIYKRFLKSHEFQQLLESSPSNQASHGKKSFLPLPNFMTRAASPKSKRHFGKFGSASSPSHSHRSGSGSSPGVSFSGRSVSIENLIRISPESDAFMAELCGGAQAKVTSRKQKVTMRHSASAEHLIRAASDEKDAHAHERRVSLSRTKSDTPIRTTKAPEVTTLFEIAEAEVRVSNHN
eukprot:m.51340 g.51340  ORF g.51340 m.51340 type:complete len:576 (+) comp34133_c0_seq2:216-1943(+)